MIFEVIFGKLALLITLIIVCTFGTEKNVQLKCKLLKIFKLFSWCQKQSMIEMMKQKDLADELHNSVPLTGLELKRKK